MKTPEELRRLADSFGSICEAIQYGSNGLFGVETIGPIKQAATALREYAESLDQQKSPEELGYVPLSDDGRSVFIDGMGEVRLAIESPGQEPDAFMWQHEETGRTGFVDLWQVENNWQENNPRLKIIGPLFTHPPSTEPVDNHASDCATHNSPAYPNGPCDCQPTQDMCRAAVEYINGAGVYDKVPAEALEIEEGIYAEVWKAMQAAAPNPEPAIKQRLTTEPKPCPFCGSTDGTDEQGDTYRWRRWACVCGAKGPDVRCHISGSGHGGEDEARQLAIAEWNTRAAAMAQEVK